MGVGESSSSFRSALLRLRRRVTRLLRMIGLSRRGWVMVVVLLLLAPTTPWIFRSLSEIVQFPRVVISLVSPTVPTLPTTDGRTNVLLLGTAGQGHDGKDLTDTIIVASVDTKMRDVVLLSLPRDLWVPELNSGTRLNAAYAIGEAKRPGGGLILAKSMASHVTGLFIHYAVRIDFSGFARAVDQLGGLDIIVDRSFDDFRYPIAGRELDFCEGDVTYACRYEHIHFDAGLNHMDGATALKFVRSRMGTNEEGTDFARTRRQQKVLFALREELFSTSLLFNPGRIKGLYDTFGESIDTDIPLDDFGKFYRLIRHLQDGRARPYVLDDTGHPPLLDNPRSTEYGGQWILIPRDPKWEQIHAWVDMIISTSTYVQPTPTSTMSAISPP